MSSTAYDDQFVTISSSCGAGTTIGSGGVGTSYKGYGAVPPTGAVGATGSFTLPSGTITLMGGGGGTGSYGTLSASSSHTSSISMSTSILSIMAEGDGDAIIKTKKNTINLDEMASVMSVLKERLLILTPNFELHEKYPALKDAYEQYKVLEAMLSEENKK